jgi:hypothetical protein
MSNTLLTPDMITRESLRVLHQKLNFVGTVNRQYDDSFANEGAKIGNTLRIRRPIEYISSTGATMATGTGADSVEQNFTLTVNTQRKVPMRFTSNELTMKLDDFSKRIIDPAMARLAAKIESDALGDTDQIYNFVNAGTKVEFAEILSGRKKLIDNLAGTTGLKAQLDTQANVDLVDALKGLFQDSSSIAQQYKEGMIGRTASFDFYENTILPTHTWGAEGAGSAYLCNATAAQVGTDVKSMSLIVDTGTKTIKKGDVFTIENVNRVHPETKVDTGVAQQFTILADATGAGTISIAPGIIASGPRQNCSAGAANNAKLTFKGTASTTFNQSLLYHPDAFVFATADLVMPKGVDFASRQVFDGISMRILRDYDIVKDRILCRVDVLYGHAPLYKQLACKVMHT